MQLYSFPLGSLWTNCYLLAASNGDAVVVDPGGPAGEVSAVINKEKLNVKWILLTHGHVDHIAGIGELRPSSANGVAIMAEDADCLTNARANLSSDFGGRVEMQGADRLMADGDSFELGDMSIDVIATPGHTRGGCCFYASEGDDALLISGDTLFARSIGRTDFPGGDEPTLIDSLRKLAKFPDELAVFPGHGPATTIGEERALNPFWPR